MSEKKNAATSATTESVNYGFNFNFEIEQLAPPYDNEGACAELAKDMQRGDNFSLRFSKDAEGYPSVWVESKNVSAYKVLLNQSIFTWIMQYIETGKAEYLYDSTPMAPIEADVEAYKIDMLKLFIRGGKKIQWAPLFRERNGKLSGTYIAKQGKIFFYVERKDELIDWLREMKQAI